jgi:hypothetical protein
VANRNSRIVIPVRAVNYDGRYWGDYPNGNKPNTGALLQADALGRVGAAGQLSTAIRLGAGAQDVENASGGLSSGIKLAAGAQDVASAIGALAGGATLGSGVLTITGSGFGTKPTAAPLFYNDFESLSDGAVAISAGIGLTDLDSSDSTANQVKVSTSRSHSGSKALRCIYPTARGSMFPQVGNVVSPGSDRVYMAQWVYYEHTTGTKSDPIFKWGRAGSNNGGAYHGVPRFYETIRPTSAGDATGCDIGYVNNDFGTYYAKPWELGYTQKAQGGGWNFIEYVYLLHPTAGIFQQKVKGVDNVAGVVYDGSHNVLTGQYGKTADVANNSTIDWAISVFDGNDSYGLSDAWTLWPTKYM